MQTSQYSKRIILKEIMEKKLMTAKKNGFMQIKLFQVETCFFRNDQI